MIYKNIKLTTEYQTIIPIYYVDNYQDSFIKEIFNQYKFKNNLNNTYLINICVDICINTILENPDSYIIFSYPPSTMFYRKEKDIDSMAYLINKVRKNINTYFKSDQRKCSFLGIFSLNKKNLKNKKAQHIGGDRKNRTKNLDERYYLNIFNKMYIKKLCKNSKVIICIIDDISSTGGTLSACKDSLKELIDKYKIEIELYSLSH